MSDVDIYKPPQSRLEISDEKDAKVSSAMPQGDAVEISGFWRRVAANLLDSAIAAPLGFLFVYLLEGSKVLYFASIIPGMLVWYWYGVWLVKKYGGTPGKILMGIRVRMLDGSFVTGTAAHIRYAGMFLFTSLGTIAGAIGSYSMSDAEFESLGIFERAIKQQELAPSWNGAVQIGLQVWIWVGLVTLLLSKKRRAVHDYLAGTIVVRVTKKPVEQNIEDKPKHALSDRPEWKCRVCRTVNPLGTDCCLACSCPAELGNDELIRRIHEYRQLKKKNS